MASSPSRRAQRNDTSKDKDRSRSSSASSEGSEAPTYRVEENSEGELVNKELGVAWPTRVQHVKRYPDYSSSSSIATSDGEDQFASSPYEMMSIAGKDAAAAAGRSTRDKPKTGRRKPSPQYVDLSSRKGSAENDSKAETDESTTKIDSVVFDTVEQLEQYQRLFRKSAKASSSTSLTSAVSTLSLGERDETERHYIGVRSRRAVEKKLKPGEFFIYYDKPTGLDIPVTIELKIGYMSSTSKIYHFPIQRFECEGEPYYVVMQTDTDVKMFPSIATLVQHYHTFSHVDPESGSLETFGLPTI